ncbi:MAG: pyridoxal phosphate-dependent aminotransferase [Patescibacteria group bacterium]
MRTVSISSRAANTPSSAIRKLYIYADQAKRRGIHVHHLNIGQPDIKTPPDFFKEVRRYAKGAVEYAPSSGYSEVIDAWRYYYETVGIKLSNEDIVVTTGGSEAILFAMLAVTDPGDEIIAFEPMYTNYITYGQMAGITIEPVLLRAEEDFMLTDATRITKKITKKTKAILVCNPSNPTGTVFSKQELQQIVDIAKKHNLFIIADEPYRELIFNSVRHVSLMEFTRIKDRVILVDSVSKRFSICGARIGSIACRNKDVMKSVVKFAQGRLSSPTLEQLAVIPLLRNPKKYTKSLISEYKLRRNVVVEALNTMPGVYCPRPQGAFYALVTLPVQDAERFAIWLLEKFSYKGETVMFAPGNGFYATKGMGKREIRIAFVLSRPKLKRAMEILRRGLIAYRKK